MTIDEKIELVRKNVISAVQKYKGKLVGKKFIYIFNDEFIEVIYKTENFMHLTGVDSKVLKPNKFYNIAKNKKLKRNQMCFGQRHPLKIALQKSKELSNIDVFSDSKIYVVKDMKTSTYTYEFCFSDKKITLGLTKDTMKDSGGNEIELDYYVPRTLRVKEDATANNSSSKVIEVKMILSKTDKEAKYNKIHYGIREDIELLPGHIKDLIDDNILEAEMIV